MILYSIVFFDGYTPFPSLYTLFPTIGAALVIIASTPNTLIHSILSKKETSLLEFDFLQHLLMAPAYFCIHKT